MAVVNALVERVRGRLVAEGGDPTPSAVAAAVRAESRGVVSDLDVLEALRVLQEEFVGAGPLDPLLRDPRTTDVLVSGGGVVRVDRGNGLEGTGIRLPDESAVRRLAQRLALAAGRRLDDASPCVDGWIAARGVRLHAVLAPVAADGTCLSLRVLRHTAHDLAALRRVGTFDDAGEALLRAVVAARLSLLVSGGTGSGKTTLLNALLSAAGPAERVIIVEDAEELRPAHPHVVRLVARPANIEGAGGVSLRELVRQALRMRPDRVIVGEVRGGEVADLLAAMNTGHDGGAGTVHANSAAEVPARLEALAAIAGMERAALHSQLAAAVQVILHMRRLPSGRVLDAIAVLDREGERVHVVPVWRRQAGWISGGRDRLAGLLSERGVSLPADERCAALVRDARTRAVPAQRCAAASTPPPYGSTSASPPYGSTSTSPPYGSTSAGSPPAGADDAEAPRVPADRAGTRPVDSPARAERTSASSARPALVLGERHRDSAAAERAGGLPCGGPRGSVEPADTPHAGGGPVGRRLAEPHRARLGGPSR